MKLAAKFSTVVIVGAGPVGLTLANALAASKAFTSRHSISLVDAGQPPTPPVANSPPGLRVFAITQSTMNVWSSLGVDLDPARLGQTSGMHIWDGVQGFSIKQEAAISRFMENDALTWALHKLAVQKGIVKLGYGQAVKSVKRQGHRVMAQCDSSTHQGEVLLLCSGRSGALKSQLGLHSYGFPYNQMGIVCSLRLQQPAPAAFQKFMPSGVLGLLPLWDNFASIVWSSDLPQFQYRMRLSDQAFIKALNQQLQQGHRHPPLVQGLACKRAAFPLHFAQAHSYVGARVALLGEDAHSVHPLFGQGLNVGIAEAAIMANHLIEQSKAGHDLGEELGLRLYERRAKLISYPVYALAQTTLWLFRSLPQSLRSLGLRTVEGLGAAKGAGTGLANNHPWFPDRFLWRG